MGQLSRCAPSCARSRPPETARSTDASFSTCSVGGFSEDETRFQLDTAIDWGRYGELFEFDVHTGELVLTPQD